MNDFFEQTQTNHCTDMEKMSVYIRLNTLIFAMCHVALLSCWESCQHCLTLNLAAHFVKLKVVFQAQGHHDFHETKTLILKMNEE